jgi:putative DNA primase/helicase
MSDPAEIMRDVLDKAKVVKLPKHPPQKKPKPANDDGKSHFAVIGGGLHFIKVSPGKDGESDRTTKTWLCDEIEVLGSGRDDAGQQYRLLQWKRQGNGEEIRIAMPSAVIGERECWATLRGKGLTVATTAVARSHLAHYLQREGGNDWYEIVNLCGWQHGTYVLPNGDMIGTPTKKMFYNGGTPKKATYEPAGSLQSWTGTVASMARENPLVAAAIACSLAGPLLSLIGVRDGIGLHLHARTSSGKSTAADCAASVWGDPVSVLHSWDGTTYGLARTAEYANDGLLYLDEIGSGDARKIGSAIYQMLNGVSRLQGTKEGGVVASRSWRLTMMSTGEVAMTQYLSEGGQTPRGGQEIRLLDVSADSGAYRVFDCLHGRRNGGDFSVELTKAARSNYGTAGRAFVAWLAANSGTVKDRVDRTEADVLAALDSEHPEAAPAARRATCKWAVLVAAAEMASEAGITGWTTTEARTWVMQAWARWLAAFGTKDRDDERLLEQANGALLMNEAARFMSQKAEADERSIQNLMGHKRIVDGETVFWVFPTAFVGEVIAGYELRHACKVLHEAGMLDRNDKRGQYTIHKGAGIGTVYVMHRRPTEADDRDG